MGGFARVNPANSQVCCTIDHRNGILMKASDYIIQTLAQNGVTHIYQVIGGMITHLIDSADRNEQVQLVTMHHEQAAAFAAHSTGLLTGVPGVAMATSGPGAVNLLTGIGSCFFDSVPAVFITGQVNLNEQKGDRPIRQLGFQETDIVSVAKPITKAAWMIHSADQIPQSLEDAFRIALSGRPGPVLLDIPMNIQRDQVEEDIRIIQVEAEEFQDEAVLGELFSAIQSAKRPLILAGGGTIVSHSTPLLKEFVQTVKVPVVNSLMAVDALPFSHPYRVGLIGSYGNRWANLALGNCDLLLVLGSRLDIRQTGADVQAFQSGRTIFHVDCNSGEINGRVKNSRGIIADVHSFLEKASLAAKEIEFPQHAEWEEEIRQWHKQWPDINEITGFPGINPNQFMHALSHSSAQAAGYVVDVGNHQMWAAQSLELNAGQCFITSGGMGSMGFSLPAAIGASIALNQAPMVQVCGDGGFQMNIQEMETIALHHLPIKMVIINNQSLGMVRQFQQSYFHERYAGTYKGYSAPDFEKVARAYGINAATIQDKKSVQAGLQQFWKDPREPFLLNVMIDPMINAYPKLAFGYSITEMEPFIKPLDMEGT